MLGLYDRLNTEAPPAQPYTVVCEYDANNNLIYEGRALASRGGDIFAAIWSIRKFTYDAANNMTLAQWAHGNAAEDNVWNSRATYEYV